MKKKVCRALSKVCLGERLIETKLSHLALIWTILFKEVCASWFGARGCKLWPNYVFLRNKKMKPIKVRTRI